MGTEALMETKPGGKGSCTCALQPNLKFGVHVDFKKAQMLCCFNRELAEPRGYMLQPGISWQTELLVALEIREKNKSEFKYFDSASGIHLFTAPQGRSISAFIEESRAHGWPSFRDEEVVWENVRVLPGGETVSVTGSHLGHNFPDWKGNRYCINLSAIAGNKNNDKFAKHPNLPRLKNEYRSKNGNGNVNEGMENALLVLMMLPEILFSVLLISIS